MPPENLSFIIDTQLPPVLAAFFNRKGFSAAHTSKIVSNGQFMTDDEIISIAIDNNLIVVTKDKDFVDYFFTKGYPPRILQLQVGNIKNDNLVNLLDANLNEISKLFNSGHNLLIFNENSITAY
jgi:predicted nuclease of predicted toxin-antitoxin system